MSTTSNHLPDKDVMCHRTGFEKPCRLCVTQLGCRLWKSIRLDVDRETGKLSVEHWDCVDAHAHTLAINMLGRQDTTSASVDHLRKEVREANDSGMANAMVGINRSISRLADAHDVAQIASSQQKLLEAN